MPRSSHRRILELATAIKSTFEPVIQTHLYSQLQINLFVQVLQQDVSLLSASISATALSFIPNGIVLFDFVCTVSSGVHSSQPLLDLTTLEENDIPHLTVVVRPLTAGSVPHTSRFEEIFCLTGKGHSQGNAARRQTADGRPSHAMGDGSTSLVAGVPEALMTTTMICTLTRVVTYFADDHIELSIMVSGGSLLFRKCLQRLFCGTLTHYISV